MFDKLLKNKSIQKAFLSQFKEIIERENLRHIVININDNGDFEPVIYKDEIKVITVKEYNDLINALKSTL